MSEFVTNFLLPYAFTVGVVAFCALVGWVFNYLDYIDQRWSSARDRAASCLVFVPLSLIWPFFAVRAVVRAMRNTLEGR